MGLLFFNVVFGRGQLEPHNWGKLRHSQLLTEIGAEKGHSI